MGDLLLQTHGMLLHVMHTKMRLYSNWRNVFLMRECIFSTGPFNTFLDPVNFNTSVYLFFVRDLRASETQFSYFWINWTLPGYRNDTWMLKFSGLCLLKVVSVWDFSRIHHSQINCDGAAFSSVFKHYFLL